MQEPILDINKLKNGSSISPDFVDFTELVLYNLSIIGTELRTAFSAVPGKVSKNGKGG